MLAWEPAYIGGAQSERKKKIRQRKKKDTEKKRKDTDMKILN